MINPYYDPLWVQPKSTNMMKGWSWLTHNNDEDQRTLIDPATCISIIDHHTLNGLWLITTNKISIFVDPWSSIVNMIMTTIGHHIIVIINHVYDSCLLANIESFNIIFFLGMGKSL